MSDDEIDSLLAKAAMASDPDARIKILEDAGVSGNDLEEYMDILSELDDADIDADLDANTDAVSMAKDMANGDDTAVKVKEQDKDEDGDTDKITITKEKTEDDGDTGLTDEENNALSNYFQSNSASSDTPHDNSTNSIAQFLSNLRGPGL